MEYPHNEESLKHHHYADGSNFISRTGREYYNIFPAWDWQKVPGTTVVQKPEIPHWNQIVKKGKTDFVGAVSDGMYGAAVFDFVSPHDPLVARKSWFFFDDEYVCLGTGIQSDADYPVFTTVNQTLLSTDIIVKSGGKEKKLKKGEHQIKDVDWVFHDSVAYFFPNPSQVSLSGDSFTGSWQDIVNTQRVQNKPRLTKEIFSLWFDHGVKPEKESYEYVVVPGIGPSEVDQYKPSQSISILSNTTKIQAVRHQKLNITQIAYYESETIVISENLALTSRSPGLVMIETSGSGVEKITVADPTRKLEVFELELSREFRGRGHDWKVTQNGNTSKVLIRLPTGQDAGKSITLQNGEFKPGTPDVEEDLRLAKAKKSDQPNGDDRHYIGELFGGGKVIWVDDTGKHGLIAATSDQSQGISWKNGRAKTPQMYGDHGDRVTNARGDGIYAGQANTALIIAQQTEDDITGNFAAKVCNECAFGGYGDWYLPSKAELEMIYQLRKEIGDFDQEMYWSSTEYNIGFVWGQNFKDYGGQYSQNKGSNYAVRCVRKF
jgi:chondroitin AC lyase